MSSKQHFMNALQRQFPSCKTFIYKSSVRANDFAFVTMQSNTYRKSKYIRGFKDFGFCRLKSTFTHLIHP